MELISGRITKGQIRTEIIALTEILIRHQIETMIISFGWACDDKSPDMWKDYSIAAAELPAFIEQHEDGVGFVPGRGDLHIKCDAPEVEIKFCHDSDIHVRTSIESVYQTFLSRWKKKRFPGYSKVEDKWVPWDERSGRSKPAETRALAAQLKKPKQKQKLESKLAVFVRQYARKRQKVGDPNDRSYDRKIEERIKHMKPEQLDQLLNGDGADETAS